MQKNIIKFLLLIIAFTFALSANYIFAVWTGPTQAPPGGNTPTPVHVGAVNQVKDGGLSLNSLAVFGNSFFDGNVGIGVTNPQAKLDVAGGIKVGDMISCVDGSIRYSDIQHGGCKDFEGCTNGVWVSLTGDTCVTSTCSLFTYTDWGACQPDSTQKRAVEASSPEGCSGGNPVTSQSCAYIIGGGTQDRIILWGWYPEWSCSGVWGDAYASGPSYSCRVYCSTGVRVSVPENPSTTHEITCTAPQGD